MGRQTKAPTEQIRISSDFVDLAWSMPTYGYRGLRGRDFLSDLVRPLLLDMESASVRERLRQTERRQIVIHFVQPTDWRAIKSELPKIANGDHRPGDPLWDDPVSANECQAVSMKQAIQDGSRSQVRQDRAVSLRFRMTASHGKPLASGPKPRCRGGIERRFASQCTVVMRQEYADWLEEFAMLTGVRLPGWSIRVGWSP